MNASQMQRVAQEKDSQFHSRDGSPEISRKKGKGGKDKEQALLHKLDRLHDNALDSIERSGEAVKTGFKELLKFIRFHEKYWENYKKQLRKNASLTPVIPPTWTAIEEYVMIANSEMILRAAALDFQPDVQYLLHEALRFLGPESQDDGLLAKNQSDRRSGNRSLLSNTRSGSTRGTTSASSSGSAKRGKNSSSAELIFSEQGPLRRALKGIVLNNQAVLRKIGEESISNVIVMLQRALGISQGGPFCTVILYNLAVSCIACGRFDDAVETVSRCLDITNGYLQGLKPPSMRRVEKEEEEKSLRDKNGVELPSLQGKKGTSNVKGGTGKLDRSREAAGFRADSVAVRSHRGTSQGAQDKEKVSRQRGDVRTGPKGVKGILKKRKQTTLLEENISQEENEERMKIERERKIAILQKKWRVYSTYVVILATHSILCHHAISTLAVWCGMEGLEQFHCELALRCAKKYLPAYHPLQSRCQGRLLNALNSALPRVEQPAGLPPQLPLLSLVDFSATPCALVAALPSEESPFCGSLSLVANASTVRVSDMLTLTASISKPPEITEFVQRMVAQAQQMHKNGNESRSHSATSLPRVLRVGSRAGRPSTSSDRKSTSQARGGSAGSPSNSGRSSNSGNGVKRKKGKGSEETKLPPLERLLPPIHSEPPIAADGHPQHITVVPRIAYERYQHLNENTVAYVRVAGIIAAQRALEVESTTGEDQMSFRRSTKKYPPEPLVPSSFPLEHGFRSRSRRVGVLTSSPTLSRPSGRQLSPTQLLVQYDEDLHQMSHLVKDLLPEVRFRAAQMIQRQWRYYSAHLALEKKLTAAKEWRTRMEAASNIMWYYKRWRERFPAVVAARRLRYLHYQGVLLTKVQSFLYQMQSIEVWGERCVSLYERLLAEKKQRATEAAAATMIQSAWRMVSTQRQIEMKFRTVTRIQTQWRCHTARRVLLEKRVHKKLEYEDFLKSNEESIIYIQRWYIACKARKAVSGLLAQKRKEIDDYLRREEEFFDKELGNLMDDPFLEMKGHKIMSVLRGAKVRNEIFRQWKAKQVLQDAIGKYALRFQGKRLLAALRDEKCIREVQQRRREEVEDAAVRIQCMYRQYQARQQVSNLRECFMLMDDSALRIQRAYHSHRLRLANTKANEWEKCRGFVTEMGLLRNYAAERIQALWRSLKTQENQKFYLHFSLIERHKMARKIQCAWRKSRATSRVHCLKVNRQESCQATALYRQRSVAATKVASVFRMYQVRKALPASPGYKIIRTSYQKRTAARCIQCAWRRFASKQYVDQVRLAAVYSEMQKVTLEAHHAYATLIQAVVRGRILNPLRVARFFEEG